MKFRKDFNLPEFVEFLVNISKKTIPELAGEFSLNVATVYNWKTGKTKKVNRKQIETMAGKLKGSYKIDLGRITGETIELINIPVQYSGNEEDKVKFEALYVMEVSYLLNKVKSLEAQNENLINEVIRLKQKHEPGQAVEGTAGGELSLFNSSSQNEIFYTYSQVI